MAKKDWMVKESDLDDDQLRVLHATLDKSCIVTGCAGSGKSVLALIKAQRIQKEKGDSYKVIVYTKALCNYMSAGKEALGLKNDFYYHKEWKWGREPKDYANGQSYMVYAKDELGQMIPYKPSADYIIVDEIQDFSDDEVAEFIDGTKKNFFFFGDAAQSVYYDKKSVCIDNIKNLRPLVGKPKYFELYRNYRLPKGVARVVQHIGINLDGYDEDTYKNPEPSTPRFIQYTNLEEQIKAIVKIINNNTLTDVGILLPANEDVKIVSGLLSKHKCIHEAKYKENWKVKLNFRVSNPKVMTYHSAKGLQFETVFLPSVSELSTDKERREYEQKALYVAMTRTYRDLYVMYSGTLPAPLCNVPENLIKTSEIDEVEDI